VNAELDDRIAKALERVAQRAALPEVVDAEVVHDDDAEAGDEAGQRALAWPGGGEPTPTAGVVRAAPARFRASL
jgi:hypothetical protein